LGYREVDVAAVTRGAPLRPLPLVVASVCGVLAMCDGLDNQALAFTAPVIAEQWGLKMPDFVPVFSIGLFGLMVGSLVGGWLGDRFGRKRALLLAAFCFGVTTLATPLCSTLDQLIVLRFVGGLGIGGLPAALSALIAESAPERSRATLTLWALVGIPTGGFLGGFAASWLLPLFGWPTVFCTAGAVSLLALVLALILVPESVHFLALRQRRPRAIADVLNRIDPGGGFRETDRFVMPAADRQATSVATLFTEGRARMTLLFWVAEFVELMIYYVLANWIPTLLRQTGASIQTAAWGTAVLNLGAILVTILLGPVYRRVGGQRFTAATFVVTSLALAVIIVGAGHLPVMMIGVFFAGAGGIGGQVAITALMASRYPTAIRSSGIGWALTVGRIGSILSPTLVGVPLALGWSAYEILALPIVPSLVGGLCVLLARPGGGPLLADAPAATLPPAGD
jgi:AAHS family 4-hydroxybenzoate transporter-like MFS transporter